MEETINISLTLIQARRLSQFRTDHGKGPRILGMIYFNKLGDGTLWMENIKEDTDVKRLKKQIHEGRIYVVESVNRVGC